MPTNIWLYGRSVFYCQIVVVFMYRLLLVYHTWLPCICVINAISGVHYGYIILVDQVSINVYSRKSPSVICWLKRTKWIDNVQCMINQGWLLCMGLYVCWCHASWALIIICLIHWLSKLWIIEKILNIKGHAI